VVFVRVHGVILWNYYVATAQLKYNRLFTIVRFGLLVILIYPMTLGLGMAGAAAAVLVGELTGFGLQVVMLSLRIAKPGPRPAAGKYSGDSRGCIASDDQVKHRRPMCYRSDSAADPVSYSCGMGVCPLPKDHGKGLRSNRRVLHGHRRHLTGDSSSNILSDFLQRLLRQSIPSM